jgi:hypothetical protein
MTLADLLTAAVPLSELAGLALVFDADLRDRLVAVQDEHGNPRFTAHPARLADGRYMHQASILTECQPGGLYHAGFSRLDPGRFNEIDAMPYADAVALLPESPSPVS